MMSCRALAPVAACGEATKPGLAPNGSLNQQSQQREGGFFEPLAKRFEAPANMLLKFQACMGSAFAVCGSVA